MRRIALAALSTTALLPLSGCGVSSIIDAVANKDEPTTIVDPVPSTSSEAPKSTSTKTTSSKPSSTKTSSTKTSAAKSSAPETTEKEVTGSIPPEQQDIIMDALEPLILAHVTDTATETMEGKIRFNKDMKPTSFTGFKLNGQSVTPDPTAKAEAEKVFEKLAGTPRDKRFTELEFKFANERIEATALYPNG